ncbi:MAG: Rv1355c family protein [Pseudonocardiaceae bacterium]
MLEGTVGERLVRALRRQRSDGTAYAPRILDPHDDSDRVELLALAEDRAVVVADTVGDQLDELVRSRRPDRELGAGEVSERVAQLLGGRPVELFGRWVYYPWAARLVHVLPQPLHRELRLDRNRYKITTDEQERLLSLRVAVAGLSVGRAVSSTLAREGIGGQLRLADFDVVSLSNLNRVAGGTAEVGVAKVVLAAREVAELDPYLQVVVHPGGVRPETLDGFLAGVDVLVEECDDLEMKLRLREHARALGVPVVMVTSDRGLLDVERFDREPGREPFHGLLAGVRAADLRGLSTRQKVPYVLRLVDAGRLEPRLAASLVEVKQTISTWPQLASAVALGGAMAANAVRRIALGELTESGRYEVDLDHLVRDGASIPIAAPRPWTAQPAGAGPRTLTFPTPGASTDPPPGTSTDPTREELRFLVDCATTAPSGGNAQPWRFVARRATLCAEVDPVRSASPLNIADRASFLALGAALEAVLVGATALGFAAHPTTTAGAWRIDLHRTGPPARSRELDLLARRCCNRTTTPSAPIPAAGIAALAAGGGPLQVIAIDQQGLPGLGEALAELTQVQFLSPTFHGQLVSEIRWSTGEALTTRDGIDLALLDLDAAGQAMVELLRSAPAMAVLRRLGLGRALGGMARESLSTAGAALLLGVRELDRATLVDSGRGLLRMWLAAVDRGIGVHPWGAPFLLQHWREAPSTLDPVDRAAVARSAALLADAGVPDDVTPLLVLRLTTSAGCGARSLRRDVAEVLTFAE